MVAGTTGEGAALSSILFVGLGSGVTVEAGNTGDGANLFSFTRSAWAETATMLAGTTGKSSDLASVLSVGFGSARNCSGGHDS